jgi:hypothetical protein
MERDSHLLPEGSSSVEASGGQPVFENTPEPPSDPYVSSAPAAHSYDLDVREKDDYLTPSSGSWETWELAYMAYVSDRRGVNLRAIRKEWCEVNAMGEQDVKKAEKKPGFWQTVNDWTLHSLQSEVPDVYANLAERAKTNDNSAKLFLSQLGQLKEQAMTEIERSKESDGTRVTVRQRLSQLSLEELARVAGSGEGGGQPPPDPKALGG